MKVCPNCQSRFDQGESFCPNDGSKLVDAEKLSPGEWTGRELGEAVRLDELYGVDPIGERYRGTLLSDQRAVRVTVFNQDSEPLETRLGDVKSALDQLQNPIPPEILAVHSFQLDEETSYVVEQTADGQTLREVLDDQEKLPWKSAIRIAAHLAQALHWMAERGHIHRGLHPGAIYITDVDEGTVQVGDWLQAALTFEDEPMERAENGAAFVGFAPYMPPEMIRDEGTFDERSLNSDETTETLKRHLHEKPLKLKIASGSEDFHPELDDVLSMMWGKSPDERFQTPKATIAALSSLVDESPRNLAPAPSIADKAVFEAPPEGEDEADAGDSVDTTDKTAEEKPAETMLGIGGPSPASETQSDEDEPESSIETGEAAIEKEEEDDERDRVSSSEMPSIIIEDPELRSAMDGGEAEDEEEDDTSDDEADEEPDEASESASDVETDGSDETSDEDEPESDDEDDEGPESEEADGEQPEAEAESDLEEIEDGDGEDDTESDVEEIEDGDDEDDTESDVEEIEDGDDEDDTEATDSEEDDAADEEPEADEAERNEEVVDETDDTDDEPDEDEPPDEDESGGDEESSGFSLPAPSSTDDEEIDDEADDADDEGEVDENELEDEAEDDGDDEEDTEEDETLDEDEGSDIDASDDELAAQGDTDEFGFQYTADTSDVMVDDSVDVPSSGALITGFVDGETGITYSPDSPEGTTRPVRATDFTRDEESGLSEGDERWGILSDGGQRETEADDADEAPEDADDSGVVSGESATVTTDDEETEDAQGKDDEKKDEETDGEGDDAEEPEATDPPDRPDDAADSGESASSPDLSDYAPGAEQPGADMTDEWFEVSEEEAWMAADVREERDRSEVLRQYATWAFLAFLIIFTVGLVIYSETYTPQNDKQKGDDAQTTSQEK